MSDESLLTTVATSLKSTIFDLFHQNCEEMILFGSFARGDNEEGSDIDIMLLVDASREEIASKNWQIGDAAAELLLMYGVVVSPIVENREYFQKNLNYLPFFRNIDREGCVSLPDQMLIDLSRYRIERAAEMLAAAKREADAEDYASANNRAYYCIFHAMRSILALDGEDFKKHSAVISRFSLNYLKTDILPRDFGKLISNASLIRNRSDYEDFYVCSVEDTMRQIEGAEEFLACVRKYLSSRYEE